MLYRPGYLSSVKERVARPLPDRGFLTIKGLTTGGETA
jgi:hypothetical protein